MDGRPYIGLAYVEPMLRHIGACEFADDSHLRIFENVVTQLGPREAVIPEVNPFGYYYSPSALPWLESNCSSWQHLCIYMSTLYVG